MMKAALGIDTGGTYTDAVLVDHVSREVLAHTKALTTHHDLTLGIGEAVSAVLASGVVGPDEISLVSISTTLATNAIVEGKGSPICLLLIGYDPFLIRQYGFEQDLATDDVVYLSGGHDGDGNEVQPLDEDAAREAIQSRLGQVDAFAVSGYFSVRNPAHELRLRALIEELAGDIPVTCGHELSTRLNAVRRATTVALNARLIPLLCELIAMVRSTLETHNISAPLMVVRGDGSLVRAAWAMRRPIETILSGPAASVIGAWHLAGCQDAWVVDIGGTTTDIAVLRDGRPRINPEGARVGRWQTMVEALDVHTVGLGGDSMVRITSDRQIEIGPRRVVPLCMLASQHPRIKRDLEHMLDVHDPLAVEFVTAYRETASGLSDGDRRLLQRLNGRPVSLRMLIRRQEEYGLLVARRIEALETRRLVQRAGFTPTDALHVLGRFQNWDSEASWLGARLLAGLVGLTPEAFCEQVVRGVSDRVSSELVDKVLRDEGVQPDWQAEPAAAALLARALGQKPQSALRCQMTLTCPLVAIGAPAEAYLPQAAAQLHSEAVVPPYWGVANAVGAAVGGVAQQVRVLIRPLDAQQIFRLHLPDGVRDFDTLEDSVDYARTVVPVHLESLARQAGTDQVEIQMARIDQVAPVASGWGQEVYLGTELTFTAFGRPSYARTDAAGAS